jgi:hypothetical protein
MAEAVDLNKNFTVKGGPSLDVKKVDQVVLSYPQFDVNADNRKLVAGTATKSGTTDSVGDVVKDCMDHIANHPRPRKQMHGQQNSKTYKENGKAFISTPVGLDSDAGN